MLNQQACTLACDPADEFEAASSARPSLDRVEVGLRLSTPFPDVVWHDEKTLPGQVRQGQNVRHMSGRFDHLPCRSPLLVISAAH